MAVPESRPTDFLRSVALSDSMVDFDMLERSLSIGESDSGDILKYNRGVLAGFSDILGVVSRNF